MRFALVAVAATTALLAPPASAQPRYVHVGGLGSEGVEAWCATHTTSSGVGQIERHVAGGVVATPPGVIVARCIGYWSSGVVTAESSVPAGPVAVFTSSQSTFDLSPVLRICVEVVTGSGTIEACA